MNIRLLTYSLTLLGIFWVLTGAWAALSVDSFIIATERPWADPFAVQANGGLFVLLGLGLVFRNYFFLVFRPVAYAALLIIAVVLSVEMRYLPEMNYPLLLSLDFILESIFALLIVLALFWEAILSMWWRQKE
jgi:hypothetical protein